MSNPTSFVDTYARHMQALAALLEDVRALNDWLVQDPTMLDRYFAQPTARTDITKQDVEAAQSATGQVIFAYDSGAPTQKSAILKMIP